MDKLVAIKDKKIFEEFDLHNMSTHDERVAILNKHNITCDYYCIRNGQNGKLVYDNETIVAMKPEDTLHTYILDSSFNQVSKNKLPKS